MTGKSFSNGNGPAGAAHDGVAGASGIVLDIAQPDLWAGGTAA